MNYENKLALAKKALESDSYDRETIEYIFPELAESEDERIRKEIVRFIQMEVEDEMVGNKWLAWLEKQGEQNLIMAKSPQLSEQKPSWSEEDEKIFNTLIQDIQERHPKAMWNPKAMWIINCGSTEAVSTKYIIDWLKSLKERIES
jgi:hypothetical protein